MNERRKAIVLLSGGQDSTTAFYWALENFDVIGTLTFDYGQRHEVETALARATSDKNDIPNELMTIDPGLFGESSLTNPNISNLDQRTGVVPVNRFAKARGLPPSFTPGRNLIFFTVGAMVCARKGADVLVSGVCQTDAPGYPDCRAAFVDMMQAAIWSGFDWTAFTIVTPIIKLTKVETWVLAAEMGRLDEIIHETMTCYEGDTTQHEWGPGCGVCGACVERCRGYELFIGKVRT